MNESKSSKLEMRLPDLNLTWPSWRWFDDMFRDVDWRPMIRVEQCHEGDSMVVRAEVPGVDPDKDITVEVVDHALVITAEKHQNEEHGDRHFYRSEFRYGSLTRSIPLPEGVDESHVTATYKDGVLEVKMPMPQAKVDSGTTRIEVMRG
jgi:HSP20 family protein